MANEILVVDDNLDIRKLISGIHNDQGMTVREAATFDQAMFKINKKMNESKMSKYLEVLKLCSELKVKFFFCSTALQFLDIRKNDFIKNINIESTPLYHVINENKNNKTFFI